MFLTRRPEGGENLAISAARYLVIDRCPYFSILAFRVPVLVVTNLHAVSSDRQGRLYIGEFTLRDVDVQELSVQYEFALHHTLRGHAMRLGGLPQSEVAGVSACLEISDDLMYGTQPAEYGLDGQLAAETYYRLLIEAGQEVQDPGHGSGSGGEAAEYEVGDDGDPQGRDGSSQGDAISDAERQLIEKATAEAIKEYVEKNHGSVPAGVQRWVNETLAPPKVSWQTVLRSIVRGYVAQVAGRSDYSFRRPSRRPSDNVVRPSMVGTVPRIAIVVDTSGSMSQDLLSEAMSELNGVLRSVQTEIYVVACDSEAADGVQRVVSLSDVDLRGGGGTDMVAGMVTAASISPHVIIVLTDGYTDWSPIGIEGVQSIVGVVGGGPAGPPWATTIRIEG